MKQEINEYLSFVRRNYTPITAARYASYLERLEKYCNRPLAKVDTTLLEQYMDNLLQGRRPSTANTHLTAIKSFWAWYARRHGGHNIAADVPWLKRAEPRQRFLTEDEYQAVLGKCRPMARDLIQLYGNTGLRRAEMLALRWPHISADMRSLQVPRGKGGKARIIPLNPVCRDILTRNHIDNSFHFLRRWGSESGHNHLCARLAELAHIPVFGPHALRHRFATQLIRSGVPLKIVSKILGHSSIATTEQIYCHLLPLDLLGTTEALAM